MATYSVTTNANSGQGSLRQAILDANATSANDEIVFDSSVFLGGVNTTITLASGFQAIAATSGAGSLTITGPAASSLTISANSGDFSVFSVASGGNLSISGLTVTGANVAGEGGAFYNAGTLTVNNSIISGNAAGFAGGGIRNFFGIVTVTNSTVASNTSTFSAGISATGGTTTVANSTFFDNIASSMGGGIGIFNGGTVFVYNSTLSGNAANAGGGGIYADGGTTLNIANTIIANSTSGGDFAGSGTVNVTSPSTAANNLVSQGTFSWATTKTSSEINLGTLANNGGPTPTQALLANSVAINAGNAAISNAAPVSGLDQRGYTRSSSSPSIGAYEFILPSPSAPVCFLIGTLIRMADGSQVPIQELRIGDCIATSKGPLPIKWIAKRTVWKQRASRSEYKKALPVRIQAGSLGDGIPRNDLLVSRCHGMWIDGRVVNAKFLENGVNIDQVSGAEYPDYIQYLHLEFEDEVLVEANGALACSYVNLNNRRYFDNYPEFISRYRCADLTASSVIKSGPRNRPSLKGHKDRTRRGWMSSGCPSDSYLQN
jgi:hypothetical protein